MRDVDLREAHRADAIEVGRELVGKGGVVREAASREAAVERIRSFVAESGWKWQGVIESPITGREGNVEYLAHLKP